MDNKEEEFLKRIKDTFRIEAEEHLRAFFSGLIELEKPHTKERLAEITETLFREIHSLKGAARSVDHRDVESLCQPLESVFSSLKRNEISLSPGLLGLFYKTADWLKKLLSNTVIKQNSSDRKSIKELIDKLKTSASGRVIENVVISAQVLDDQQVEPMDISSEVSAGSSGVGMIPNESVRIRISKLDPLFLQAEELVQTKIAIKQRTLELAEISDLINDWVEESHRRRRYRRGASFELCNELMNDNDIRLNKLENRVALLSSVTKSDLNNLNRLVDSHLDAMKQILILPVSTLVENFPAMVRDISSEQNKEIEFIIRGTELEIDKRILEDLKDPLIHLIRNSIDHGINKPKERILLNKPAHGKIILSFTARENGLVEITLSDDGMGIDVDRLIRTAIKAGILSEEAAGKLEPKEVLNLIYQSGISTSSIITNISGHGLGLSIVREKVIGLNGKISVETEKNKGTTFRILLPMTLATFRGIVVRVKEFMFVVPTMNVERVLNVDKDVIKTVENFETINIDDKITSVADLGEVLGLTEKPASSKMVAGLENSNFIRLIVLNSDEQQIAFKVDEIIDEQQVLVKGLGKLLKRVKNISGATILGSGKVVPVLNINDLIKSSVRVKGKMRGKPTEEISLKKSGKILVTEDSITSRTMLKNILETAGYEVVTAVDGLDGFTKARDGEFDLILSDVDMPKLNGFELTTKVRGDKKISELPIILLTALGSVEDRERGIEVGADAYIVKNSFDQGNLLEIIRKLI